MATTGRNDMAHGRALLTDAERKHISGRGDSQQLRYEAVSRVRRRMEEDLTTDVELLAEHHPDLMNELRQIVCPE